jgi:hypothetical protein
MKRSAALVLVLLGCSSGPARPQQVADTTFAPPVPRPAWAAGQGPRLRIDEAHGNFHTAAGRYRPFAELLRRDGYRVEAGRDSFSTETLRGLGILVVANALATRNQEDWSLPNPSPFGPGEIAAVRGWVEAGGALLLIADHMPFAGAAQDLGAAFGARWSNGFAVDRDPARREPFVFRRDGGGLAAHPVVDGRAAFERVDAVATFTGSAFRIDGAAAPLLVLGANVVSYEPRVAWQFDSTTTQVEVAGWLQGAVLRRGAGRVALFGEAALFTAQVAGPDRRPMGMNAPVAAGNPQFLLNVLHWLSGLVEPDATLEPRPGVRAGGP